MEVNEQPPPLQAPAPPPHCPMIKEICVNSGAALGCHLANDLWCQDDARFAELLRGIPEYLERFTEPKYWKRMSASCGVDQENPFQFNENSNQTYMHSYIDVFRHCSLTVPEQLYLKYLTQGLLDRRHH